MFTVGRVPCDINVCAVCNLLIGGKKTQVTSVLMTNLTPFLTIKDGERLIMYIRQTFFKKQRCIFSIYNVVQFL